MSLYERTTQKTSVLWALAAALSALIVGCLTSGGTRFNLHEPLQYASDAIFYLISTQRLSEGTGYLVNSRQGFPFGSQLFDFLGSDWGNMFALWGLGKASGSAAWATNVYFLAGFPLNALATFWCLRRLGVSDSISSVFALLFAIIPFHFQRLGHLYFTWYFVVPVYCWFAMEVYRDPEKVCRPLKGAVLAALACFGVYYAWFGCMVMLVGAVLGWFRHRTAKPIYAGLFAIALVAAGVAANLLPNLYLINQFGKNTEIAQRYPSESETYGLKISQLILPRAGHRHEQLAGVTDRYAQTFPNVNENMTATLGYVGVIGLFLTLASAIVYSPRVQEQRRSQLFLLGTAALFLILTATTGGFSAVFSMLVTPLIRGWNRVSLVIGFLSLAGMAVAVDGFRQRFAPAGGAKAFAGLGLAAIAAFGLWDQTAPGDSMGVKIAQAEWRRDAAFFRAVEASLPKGAAVYQLPFMRFPEAVMSGALVSYDTGNGFLHSRSLKWSFGVAAGRLGADFMDDLSKQPIATQIDVARFLGFSGFLVHRRGFADHGKAIEAVAAPIAGAAPIEDEARTMAFYSLESLPAFDSLVQLSPAARAMLERWKISKTAGVLTTRSPFDIDFQAPLKLSPQVKAAAGLSGPEEWGTWTDGKVATLQLKKPLPQRFTLDLVANAFGPNVGREITVRIGSQAKTFTLVPDMTRVRIPFELTERTDRIELTVPAPTRPKDVGPGADDRKLGLGLRSLAIVE